MLKNIADAHRQGKIRLSSIALLVTGILCLAVSFMLRQEDAVDLLRQHDTAEIQADNKPGQTATYIASLHDAAQKLLGELKESELQKDAPKIAMWTIGNDIDYYLHDALVEHIKKDNTFDVMDRASVTRIEGPASYEDLLTELAEKHGVTAILTGTIVEKRIREGKSRVLVSFCIRRVPDDALIRQYSAIKGASPLPSPQSSPHRPAHSLPVRLPNMLAGLSVMLIISGVVMLAIPDTHTRNLESSPVFQDKKHPGIVLTTKCSIGGEPSQCDVLQSLLDEILPLNSDVMMLARQNNLNIIADGLIELGAFFKKERAHIDQVDYSVPIISKDLGLLPDEIAETTEMDVNLCAEIRKCTAVLNNIYGFFTETGNSGHGALAKIEEQYRELQELTDSTRETFRERRRILDKDI